MNPYSKSIAALVGAAAAALVVFNIDISEELQGAIVVLASTVAVWIAPKNTP